MTNDLLATDSGTLASLAEGLKVDAKALANVNRPEAMRLFRLWRAITAELGRRHASASLKKALTLLPKSQAYRWN